MSYLVLARKWRPQSFEEVVGQEHVTRTLQNAIRSDRVAHAFLFCGMRGVGKTTAARLLAKALNCERGPTPTPCNACSNCVEITAGNAVDVFEVDGASNRGINEVRQIIENVRYRPAKSRFKIYIIDEVHQVTHDAFNALLKTLEEPPAHVKFIFATTEAHKVPHTILSRCQRYDFKRIGMRQVARRLEEICASDGIAASERALLLVAREADGSMRDAQSLLDQVIAFAGTQVADTDVVAALGVADRHILYAVGAAIVERQPARALEHLGELHLFGYDLRRFARELLEHVRNLAVAKLEGSGVLLADLSEEERGEVVRQAGLVSAPDIDRAFHIAVTAEEEVARSSSPKLMLEMAVLKMAALPPVLPIEDVLARLDALARGGAPGGEDGGGAVPGAGRPPASRAPAGRAETAFASAPVPANGESSPWERFVAHVRQAKPALAAHLQPCVARVVDSDRIELHVPVGFHFDYLSDRAIVTTLEALASHCLGGQPRVLVRAAEAALAPEKPAPDQGRLTREALLDPAVRAVVTILGGEVQAVKPKPPAE